MTALLEAREQRRQAELQFLGTLIAFGVNDPKNIAKLFKDAAGRRGDNMSGNVPRPGSEEILEATADMYEQWW